LASKLPPDEVLSGADGLTAQQMLTMAKSAMATQGQEAE